MLLCLFLLYRYLEKKNSFFFFGLEDLERNVHIVYLGEKKHDDPDATKNVVVISPNEDFIQAIRSIFVLEEVWRSFSYVLLLQ